MSKIKANEEKRRQRQSEREGDRGIEGKRDACGWTTEHFQGKERAF